MSDSMKMKVTILDSQFVISLRTKNEKEILFLKVTYLDLLQSVLQFGIQLAEGEKKTRMTNKTGEQKQQCWFIVQHRQLLYSVCRATQQTTKNIIATCWR